MRHGMGILGPGPDKGEQFVWNRVQKGSRTRCSSRTSTQSSGGPGGMETSRKGYDVRTHSSGRSSALPACGGKDEDFHGKGMKLPYSGKRLAKDGTLTYKRARTDSNNFHGYDSTSKSKGKGRWVAQFVPFGMGSI